MYSTAAVVVLVSLVLDFNKVNVESVTFIIDYENLLVSQITFDCVYVGGGIYLFSNAKGKILDTISTMQTPIVRRVLHSKEAQDLIFQKSPINEGTSFPKFQTLVWFRLEEGT